MNFKIDYGPWKTYFRGKFGNYDIEIASNPQNIFLVFIYDLLDDKKVGALVQGFKAFIAEGTIGSFVETSPKRTFCVIKNNSKTIEKMLFLNIEPDYLDFKEEDYLRSIDKKVMNLSKDAEEVKGLARASSIKLIEVEGNENNCESILQNPFLLEIISSYHKTNITQNETKKETQIQEKEIPIGLNRKREVIKKNPSKLLNSVVKGKEKNELQHTLYIIIESALLANNSAIIFDSENYFEGLKTPAQDETKLREEKVMLEPTAFTTKIFDWKNFLPTEKELTPELVVGLIKTGNKKLDEQIIDIWKKEDSFEENLKQNSKLTDFEKIEAMSTYKIILKKYSKIIGNGIDSTPLLQDWSGGIGKATIINTNGLEKTQELILIDSIIKKITENVSSENKFLVIPDIEEFLEKKSFRNTLQKAQEKKIKLMLGLFNSNKETYKDIVKTEVIVVEGIDVAISTNQEKSYRVILRPPISNEKKG